MPSPTTDVWICSIIIKYNYVFWYSAIFDIFSHVLMIVLYSFHPGLFMNVGRKRVSWQCLRLIYNVSIFRYVEHRTPFVLLFSQMSLGESDKDLGTKLQRRKGLGVLVHHAVRGTAQPVHLWPFCALPVTFWKASLCL